MFKAALVLIALAALAFASVSCGSDEPTVPRWRVVLEPQAEVTDSDLDAVLIEVMGIAERRVTSNGGDVVSISRSGDVGIAIEFTGLLLRDAKTLLKQTGLLEFCEPITNDSGDVAVVKNGYVLYEPGCQPRRDKDGKIVVYSDWYFGAELEYVPWTRNGADNPRDEDIVWQSTIGMIDGVELSLDSHHIRPNTFVSISTNPVFANQPTLVFEFGSPGDEILEQVTERLQARNYPLAVFLDGQPLLDSNRIIIAPQVQTTLIGGQGTISGLTLEAAEDLSILLNSGVYPVPVQVTDVSAILD